VSVDSSPPVQPPQLSPDGKWVWDGSQWRPVAGVESGHSAVFPSWKSINVDPVPLAVERAPAVQYTPAAQYQPPAVDYSYAAADEPIVPLWKQTRSTGINLYLYPVAALVLLVMAMMVLNSVGYITLPWNTAGSSSTTPSTKASPAPDFSGPDSIRADRFLTTYLAPAVAGLDKTLPAVRLHCNKSLANNCYDALTATAPQVKSVLAAIQNGDIPRCLRTPMAKVLGYVKAMDQQLQIAVTAFQDNSSDELFLAVYRFWVNQQSMVPAIAAANQAKSSCYTVVLPTWVP
jgi:hypothetical protein